MSDKKKGPPRFLFLEFLDPEINALLWGLRREFGEGQASSDIHITVRGPYDRNISREEIRSLQRTLDAHPILIHGAGIFHNPGSSVVFLRVKSDSLKDIWWKPDFPIEKFGFNPHITIYKGSDPQLAQKIYDFLREESLALVCHEFRLSPYVSKQSDLFPLESLPRDRQFLSLSNRRLVRPDILQRAAKLMAAHMRSQSRQ
ncbi:2'-5' RNA ligase family protein [Lentisalinibacter sediminis]|uniref:2'-5' RNA ligase family protein n=1 Tax=Lentisalinibacter sediminis TaxID=2992237 RepID=UPI00386DC527